MAKKVLPGSPDNRDTEAQDRNAISTDQRGGFPIVKKLTALVRDKTRQMTGVESFEINPEDPRLATFRTQFNALRRIDRKNLNWNQVVSRIGLSVDALLARTQKLELARIFEVDEDGNLVFCDGGQQVPKSTRNKNYFDCRNEARADGLELFTLAEYNRLNGQSEQKYDGLSIWIENGSGLTDGCDLDHRTPLVGQARRFFDDTKALVGPEDPRNTNEYRGTRRLLRIELNQPGKANTAMDVVDSSEALSLHPGLVPFKADWERGIPLIAAYSSVRALPYGFTWETAQARLLANNGAGLEKASKMQQGGELVGVDEEGRLMIKDGGNAPVMFGFDKKRPHGGKLVTIYNLDPAKLRELEESGRRASYWEVREAVYGPTSNPTGYELLSAARAGGKAGAVAAIEEVTRAPFACSVGSWLDNGPEPTRLSTAWRVEWNRDLGRTEVTGNYYPWFPEAGGYNYGAIRILRV